MCSLKAWQTAFKNHTKEKTGILKAERLRDALYEVGKSLLKYKMYCIQAIIGILCISDFFEHSFELDTTISIVVQYIYIFFQS